MDTTKDYRKECEKGGHQKLIMTFYRIVGGMIGEALKNTTITPTQVTVLSFVVFGLSAISFSSGTQPQIIWGALLLQLGIILDHADGTLARLKNQSTHFGAFLDMNGGHFFRDVFIPFGITLGVYRQTGETSVWILGFFFTAAAVLHKLINNSINSSEQHVQAKQEKKKNANFLLAQFFCVALNKDLIITVCALAGQMHLALIVLNIYLWVCCFGFMFVYGKDALSFDKRKI